MDNKIAELTQKIYQEGVEKAKTKADEIIKDAESRRETMLADARTEAQRIVDEAQKKARELRTTAESEVRIAGQQAVSAIRQQILDAITARVASDPVRAALSEPEVIKEMVRIVAQKWQAGSGDRTALEVILPADKQKELEKALKAGILDSLSKGLDLKFTREIKGGFQIKSRDSAFKISMTDEDFVEFFKEFVRPRTRDLLFG